jgi:hypothetical protein
MRWIATSNIVSINETLEKQLRFLDRAKSKLAPSPRERGEGWGEGQRIGGVHRRSLRQCARTRTIHHSQCGRNSGNMSASQEPNPKGQSLVYSMKDGRMKIEVRLENETVWLTQQHMADLFQTRKRNVSLHLQNIFKEKELAQDSVANESLTTAAELLRPSLPLLKKFGEEAIPMAEQIHKLQRQIEFLHQTSDQLLPRLLAKPRMVA